MSKKISKKKLRFYESCVVLVIALCVTIYGYINKSSMETSNQGSGYNAQSEPAVVADLSAIPEYTDSPYVEINNNIPYFTQEDYTTEEFERYSEWDSLGRSGVAYANICKGIMPKDNEKRGEINSIKNLSGWKQKRYDKLIKDKYLYNRCHLIGWQLSGENANKNNLITGTRYLNTEGMLPFEDKVAKYIDENESNHVLYRVTPIFKENNLLASGVQMEAWSVEDSGEGVHFNIYCYNVQPGIVIDYATGESHATE